MEKEVAIKKINATFDRLEKEVNWGLEYGMSLAEKDRDKDWEFTMDVTKSILNIIPSLRKVSIESLEVGNALTSAFVHFFYLCITRPDMLKPLLKIIVTLNKSDMAEVEVMEGADSELLKGILEAKAANDKPI